MPQPLSAATTHVCQHAVSPCTHTQIMSLTPQQLSKGLVTCSTGNHALAFVWACSVYHPARHSPSTIYLPTTASPAKVSRLQAQGAHLCRFSDDCAIAEVEARRVAGEQAWTYISPYNDWEVRAWSAAQSAAAPPGCNIGRQPLRQQHSGIHSGGVGGPSSSQVLLLASAGVQVMAGQGTVAIELLQQLSPQGVDAIIVPVGGGGLIGGIAAVVKAWNPDVQVMRGWGRRSQAVLP